MSREKGRGVAIVCRCALCDSYFLSVLGFVELAQFRGKKGKAALDDKLETMQARFGESSRTHRDDRTTENNRLEFLRCPTCIEAVSGVRYAEWVSGGGVMAAFSDVCQTSGSAEPEPEPELRWADGEDVALLSPCRFVSFGDDELPPLYMDSSEGKGKPKWKLVQGVGPPGLEVDTHAPAAFSSHPCALSALPNPCTSRSRIAAATPSMTIGAFLGWSSTRSMVAM